MREKFWAVIVDMKIAERYYWHYGQRSKFWNNIITGLCLIASGTSISAWYCWRMFPYIWAIILAISQIISVCKPLLPFSERLTACKYIGQDIEQMLVDLEYIWGATGSGISDDQFRNYVAEYEKKYIATENRFSKEGLFPQKMKLHQKAQDEAETFFKTRYRIGVE